MRKYFRYKWLQVWLVVLGISFCSVGWAAPIDVSDDAGNRIRLKEPPKKVVSLVPSATEIIFAIGAKEALCGITHHSTAICGAKNKTIVGGFSSPSIGRVMALKPDLVIISSLHRKLLTRFGDKLPLLVIKTRKMEDAFRHIQLMGDLFNRKKEASMLIAQNRAKLDLIARKTAKIPKAGRKRVMRLMGIGKLMTPGSDSFQNEMIRAAGGIAPDFGKKGSVVPVTQDEFIHFNPQVLYGCGDDPKALESFFSQDKYKSVEAVAQQRIYSLPCDLTCRAASHLGDFVAWLASLIYTDEFAQAENELLPRKVIQTRPLSISLNFVRKAYIATDTIHDFKNKSLVVEFKSPRTVVSTLEGQRDGVLAVGNHYSPPPCWTLNHSAGLTELRAALFPVIGKDENRTSFLFTGADMDNLAVKKQHFKEMTVYALVTAGVRGNAVRMSKDVGEYYEPGTINMIFLANMRLTPRAMTRAVISATEGKTAALQDLDIRSTYLPLTAAATGTGTDNIIVVQGDGLSIDNSGGHCKMGELIARAAYAGVKEAISKQNGIVAKRDIFQRLTDRHLSISKLVSDTHFCRQKEKSAFLSRVEQVLLDPAYAGFLEAAMAVSDGVGRETVNDSSLFKTWCLDVAGRIAGKEVTTLTRHFSVDAMPTPLAMALNAVFTGVSLHFNDNIYDN
jgi:iron complex transport system substrate-binding protein